MFLEEGVGGSLGLAVCHIDLQVLLGRSKHSPQSLGLRQTLLQLRQEVVAVELKDPPEVVKEFRHLQWFRGCGCLGRRYVVLPREDGGGIKSTYIRKCSTFALMHIHSNDRITSGFSHLSYILPIYNFSGCHTNYFRHQNVFESHFRIENHSHVKKVSLCD